MNDQVLNQIIHLIVEFKPVLLVLIAVIAIISLISLIKTLSPPKHAYTRTDLLTETELTFFRKLQRHAETKSLLVFPKVRVADIIQPQKGQKEWQSAFNKIKSKHVDFVLCDKTTLAIRYTIELDDPSHKRPNRLKRDKFVDSIMEQCKYEIKRFPTAKEYDFSMLQNMPQTTP